MGISLYAHNQIAYDAVRRMLAEGRRAAVVHPTGTGKSFIAFKLCEDFPEKRFCWLAPSEYIFSTQVENLRQAAGCVPENICFYTYAKLMGMTEAELAEIRPDCIILDEFHRCGAKMWGQGVQALFRQYPEVPALGLSATNIRYLDNQRDMADELFDGHVESRMSLGEAIARGILKPPKYVSAVFAYERDLEKYQRRAKALRNPNQRALAERRLEALRRALENADGLDEIFDKHMTDRHGKYIVFCAGAEHLHRMAEQADQWFARVDPAPRKYMVYYDDPGASKAFAAFKADDKADHLRLLFCIDALNEGVHVEDVSGVILLRPTISPIIYKQQIGRALSATQAKEPVIFDIVNNLAGLRSIDALEEELEALANWDQVRGDGQGPENERFRVIDAVEDCRRLFRELEEALTPPWSLMYEKARTYFQQHGDLDVPHRYRTEEGLPLGAWLSIQRRVYRGEQRGELDEERIRQLEAIGMVWDNWADRLWRTYYRAAKAYRRTYGNLDVPVRYTDPEGVKLGVWLRNMRLSYQGKANLYRITEGQVRALTALGMVWEDKYTAKWEQGYEEAAAYYETYGDLRVPGTYESPTGFRLGAWLSDQREKYRAGKLKAERQARLEALGIQWEREDPWELRYRLAADYYEANGHLRVPVKYSASGVCLNKWLNEQKQAYWGKRKQTLSPEQIHRLEAIGMHWGQAPQTAQRRAG